MGSWLGGCSPKEGEKETPTATDTGPNPPTRSTAAPPTFTFTDGGTTAGTDTEGDTEGGDAECFAPYEFTDPEVYPAEYICNGSYISSFQFNFSNSSGFNDIGIFVLDEEEPFRQYDCDFKVPELCQAAYFGQFGPVVDHWFGSIRSCCDTTTLGGTLAPWPCQHQFYSDACNVFRDWLFDFMGEIDDEGITGQEFQQLVALYTYIVSPTGKSECYKSLIDSVENDSPLDDFLFVWDVNLGFPNASGFDPSDWSEIIDPVFTGLLSFEDAIVIPGLMCMVPFAEEFALVAFAGEIAGGTVLVGETPKGEVEASVTGGAVHLTHAECGALACTLRFDTLELELGDVELFPFIFSDITVSLSEPAFGIINSEGEIGVETGNMRMDGTAKVTLGAGEGKGKKEGKGKGKDKEILLPFTATLSAPLRAVLGDDMKFRIVSSEFSVAAARARMSTTPCPVVHVEP